jgi:hypothetical protein
MSCRKIEGKESRLFRVYGGIIEGRSKVQPIQFNAGHAVQSSSKSNRSIISPSHLVDYSRWHSLPHLPAP